MHFSGPWASKIYSIPGKIGLSIHRVVVVFACFLVMVSAGCGGGGSVGGGTITPPPPPVDPARLTIGVSPYSVNVSPATAFFVKVNADASGTSVVPTINLGLLPAGLSTTSKMPMSVPASGATIDLVVDGNIAPGKYSVPITGVAGTATAQTSLSLTVISGTPLPPYFGGGSGEIAVAQGSSVSLQFDLLGDYFYKVVLSLTGLPSGVDATISPAIVQPGDKFTVTISANSNAPLAQNSELSLVGTLSANLPPATLPLVLNVTPQSGAGWSNRTDYISTRATPFSAVYDRAHELIFSSNQTWNRIDVISNLTHSLVQSVPVRDPRGLDISIDGKRVWVATGSQVMYGIDTSTLKATRYQLPRLGVSASSDGSSWEGRQVLSLADGTVMLYLSTASGGGRDYVAVWDPVTDKFTEILAPADGAGEWGIVTRSGDGKHVYSAGWRSDQTCFSYDVVTKTLSAPVHIPVSGLTAVASPDGSKIVIGSALYDGQFNLLGPLPGDGGWGGLTANGWIFGGVVFSPDGQTLYEETLGDTIPLIITIDVATREATALAPAMPVTPTGSTMSPPYYVPVPFAVDNSGLLLGIQYHGISFDDAMAHQQFVTNQSGTPTLHRMSVYNGPLSGGTISGDFGYVLSLKPDVYYGSTKGTATLSQRFLQITSPPAISPGPVNVKMLFPNGIEVYNPQMFTYGTSLQDSILSGGAPQGGAPGKLDAFGLQPNASQNVVTIGPNRATVTASPSLTMEQQTAMFLSYTVPAGLPGWTDVTVTTPNGSGTLPKAFFYAKSVTDYASTDSNSFILYDSSRNQLYLSAGDHINVFSLTSNSFLPPLQPPALGTTKQFQGLALTLDKKYLLATDLLDGSLAVISPDTPSNSYVINVAPSSSLDGCPKGPLFVAADNRGEAIVVTGGVIGSCSVGGQAYVVNLAARTSTIFSGSGCIPNFPSFPGVAFVSSTADGSMVAFGGSNSSSFQLYNMSQQKCLPLLSSRMQYGVAAAADGNIFATLTAFVDPSGNIVGRMGAPAVFYPDNSVYYNHSPYNDGALQNPALNDAGSLYYWAYPKYIDIVDVQHGMPRLRFSLTQSVTKTVSPMAIDSGGQHIYLITDKGLTIVDLGEAPLSVGHLSGTTASAGSQIVVRGSGFENGISVTLGGKIATAIRGDSNTLTFTVPSVDSGLQDLVLMNPEGSTYTLENALTVQ